MGMRYINTLDKASAVTFKEALFRGMTAEGGLFLPEQIIDFSENLHDLLTLSFPEKANKILYPYTDEIPEQDFSQICDSAFNFPVAVKQFTENLSVLELFGGPTFAFKDFGARFLAGLLSWYLREENQKSVVLVATSGDTGSAVASAFHKKENVSVVLLYPGGMVSPLQEKQLTTYGDNVTALEVAGTFDDCQRMVKEAFSDVQLRSQVMLTSANSINIGRLLPQSLYYFEAYAQIGKSQQEVSFIVPSGNLGNITSGIIAKFMGLPVWHFIAAVNNNKVFMEYLNKSVFTPASTIQTLSNAMDVGNPSNIHRLISLFHGDIESIRKAIAAFSVEDDETLTLIKSFFDRFGYVIDPHTAVGYGAFLKSGQKSDEMNILLSTAHYGKFLDVVERVIEKKYLHLPSELEIQLHKEKQAVLIPAEYSILREILLSVSA